MAGRMKNVMATYNEAEDLINIGAYKSGSNRNIDYAIYKIDAVNKFLMQQTDNDFSVLTFLTTQYVHQEYFVQYLL